MSNVPAMTAAEAEAFMRQWLAMLDSGATIDDFSRYLPDGKFEHWAYPGIQIADAAELKVYFDKAFGMIAKNSNAVSQLAVRPLAGGRFQVQADVQWTALTRTGGTMTSPLRYVATVGRGTSAGDPAGEYPKMLRYEISRA